MKTNSSTNHKGGFVVSYLILREAIGVLGLALPFILIIGDYLVADCKIIQPSISHYYYSIMHIVFTGALSVLGAFLVTYRGASSFENRVSNIAGAFSFGVTIFPTGFDGYKGTCQFLEISINMPQYIGYIHYGCATLLFTCFVIFCLNIFQKSDDNAPVDAKKIKRNKVYKFCGWCIIASMVFIAAIAITDKITGKDYSEQYDTTLIFETTSLLFFGFSWLVKGSLLWKTSSNSVLRYLAKPIR
jgi:hypothetical protein